MTPLELSDYQKKVYKYSSGHDQIKSEANYGYVCESIEINNGLYLHVRDMEYPEKGFASTTDLFSINAVKKLIIESLRLFPFIFPLILVPNRTLKAFNTIAFKIMSPCILQHQHLTPMAQELHKFLLIFLKEVGIKEDTSIQTTEIIVNIIHFDNAYRYRLQDIFNETTKEKLQNPRKEFRRLMGIVSEREIFDYVINGKVIESKHIKVIMKFKLFYWAISLVLWLPKAKKAYKKALKEINLERLQPDEADRFWMCVRDGYHYFGKTDKERKMMINHLRYVIPTKLVV